jgi:hypothetical protein
MIQWGGGTAELSASGRLSGTLAGAALSGQGHTSYTVDVTTGTTTQETHGLSADSASIGNGSIPFTGALNHGSLQVKLDNNATMQQTDKIGVDKNKIESLPLKGVTGTVQAFVLYANDTNSTDNVKFCGACDVFRAAIAAASSNATLISVEEAFARSAGECSSGVPGSAFGCNPDGSGWVDGYGA